MKGNTEGRARPGLWGQTDMGLTSSPERGRRGRPFEADVAMGTREMTIVPTSRSCHEAQMRRPVPQAHGAHSHYFTLPAMVLAASQGPPACGAKAPRVISCPCCHRLSLAGGAGRRPSSWPRGVVCVCVGGGRCMVVVPTMAPLARNSSQGPCLSPPLLLSLPLSPSPAVHCW